MKKCLKHVFIPLLAFVLCLSTSACGTPARGDDATKIAAGLYPDYSEAAESGSAEMTAEPISEHRLSVTLTPLNDEVFYCDYTFALYTVSGEVVAAVRELPQEAETEINSFSKERPLTLGVTLSLRYGNLKPGTYRLVKRLLHDSGRADTNNGRPYLPTGEYVSAAFELPDGMSECDYNADPVEVKFAYSGSAPAPDGLAYRAGLSGGILYLSYENRSETVWSYDDYSRLYKLVDDDWMPVYQYVDSLWGLMLYSKAPGRQWDDSIDLHSEDFLAVYGELEPGTYCFARQVWQGRDEDGDEYLFAAQFRIP